MQLKTAITLLDLLASKMRQSIQDYDIYIERVEFWSDASPMDSSYLGFRCELSNTVRRMNNHLIPAAQNFMDEPIAMMVEISEDRQREVENCERQIAILNALIQKWRRRTEGVTIEAPEGEHADQT